MTTPPGDAPTALPPIVRLTCTGCGWDFWTTTKGWDDTPHLCDACKMGHSVRAKAAFVERKRRGESGPA